ncbi:hypothetical protein [uncultured Desulfobulbus sp.]|uniref:hypothetical protein n=1 Tax=uncultured Desulfobulbus sp. TaxID=239745 RepID=UPI0029C6D004|nr:hypothetical protein [uncultured Desulfobulbus sp.]
MSRKMIRTILLSVTLTAVLAASQVSAQYNYTNSSSSDKKSTANIFLASDTKTNESGYGVSLTLKDDPTAAMTYVHFENFDVFQVSKSQSTHLGGFPVNVGVVLGYANNRVDNTPVLGIEGIKPLAAGDSADRPNGLLTGMEASVSLGKPTGGFSIDLRASSMSKNANPIKWISDPDLLWVGAGITLKY